MSTQHRHALVLAGWTALVWTTRIGNILGDDELSAGGRAGRLALAGSFTVLAAVVVGGVLRARPWRARAIQALALWTVAVWIVRIPGIALGDHAASFIVVHLVLATVSIVLARQAWPREGVPTPRRHRVGR